MIGPVLGLPAGVTACLFDLDGVLTDTASVHDRAWTQVFDEFLRARDGAGFTPFDPDLDYGRYVDGKRREDGIRAFLASRDITLRDQEVTAIGNRKNELLLQRIATDGVVVYDGSRRYLAAAKDAGLRRAVVSSSANTAQVLAVTGLADLVELRVDGVTAAQRSPAGKPAPDTFLAAAADLGLLPSQCAVFEDAEAGVQAGRAGAFGLVVGVDRTGHAAALREHGADVVVGDLAELLS